MSQVNINAAQPPSSNPPPGRPFRWWPIAVFIILLGIVAIVFAARQVSQNNSAKATATPGTVAADTATAGEEAVASSTPGSGATSTPTAAPGATATGSGSGGNAQPPTNPTALHVTSGSCTSHQIAWTWSGAQRATSYEVVLYDPRTGATIRDTTTPDTAYMLQAGPGATVALKVRSHNAAGTGQGYYTPGSVGHVPPETTNPTHMTVDISGQTLTWSWTGARHATAYDLVLYHYTGSTPHDDITGRTDQGHWAIKVTPGITYYLKVRSAGTCPPSDYFTPPVSAKA